MKQKRDTMTKNPFDFSDVSDLPADLAKTLAVTDRSASARAWADVVIAGKDAGFAELNINQVMAAAIRMGLTVPKAQTVRGYLNRAEELGYISKPSRQSYAAPKRGAPKAEDAGLAELADVVTADVAPVDTDPLAGL